MIDSALGDIKALFLKSGINDIHIEITWVNQCFDPSLFPINPSDEIARAFEKKKLEVLKCIMSELGGNCRMAALVNVGLTKERTTPAVVVDVKPATVANWGGITRKVQGVFNPRGPAGEIGVEFLPGIFRV
ncbi:hypothetical protein BDW59DRAFT_163473 [Aspergillus cavernicola]|uniref:Uncharacterized protein n=1 Tax=Aspergillus cavernicola TaxID=176166 RepID=A0ABR4I6D4_9EURO